MSEVQVYDDLAGVARAGADLLRRLAARSQEAGRDLHVALSGGSTPKALFEQLAGGPYKEDIDWQWVHVWWGDERTVAPDDPDSNYGMARSALLDHIAIPAGNVHRMAGELPPKDAAQQYNDLLRSVWPDAEWPRFDLIYLGMGDDGHTASLFPETAALNEGQRWAVANHVPDKDTWRLTLTAPAINAAGCVAFLVAGEGKADRLNRVLHGPYEPQQQPAQMIRPIEGQLLWLVDRAAASQLPAS